MAQVRLRPGTYKATENNTGNDKVQVDWNWFYIPQNTSIIYEVTNMGVGDDSNVEFLRIPPEPLTLTNNVGGKI